MRADAHAIMWNKTFWTQDRKHSLSYIPAFEGKAIAPAVGFDRAEVAVATPSDCMDRLNNASRSFLSEKKRSILQTHFYICLHFHTSSVIDCHSNPFRHFVQWESQSIQYSPDAGFLASRLRGQTEQPGMKEKRSSAILSHPRLAPSLPESFKTSLLF